MARAYSQSSKGWYKMSRLDEHETGMHAHDAWNYFILQYRVARLQANLGWVNFDLFRPLPSSALADGKLAEQVGKVVEHPKSKSNQPKPSCTFSLFQLQL